MLTRLIGPAYLEEEVFDLRNMQPYNLMALFEPFAKVTKDIVLYLPRTSDLNQVAQLAEQDKTLPVIHYCMQGASKVH